MDGKDIIKNSLKDLINDGVELVGSKKSQTRYVDFDDIKTSNNKANMKRIYSVPLESWVTRDFICYAFNLHRERYGVAWDLNFAGSCNEVLQLRDSLTDHIGFCDNVVLYDFIEFFFENFADGFMKQNGRFFFSQTRKTWVLDRFSKNYSYAKSLENKAAKSGDYQMVPHVPLSNKSINDVYLLSDERLLIEYGLVISVNWLMQTKCMKQETALSYLSMTCRKLYAKGKFNVVKEATEKFNPYPTWLPYKDVRKLVNRFSNDLIITLELSDSDSRFDFLKHSV